MNQALWSEILSLSVEHAVLVLVAIGAACAIGLPAAIALTRRASARRWVLGFANIGQTIPSLALFGCLVPVVGIGKAAAFLALTLYALLPILRNTLTGILGVDPAVRESAVAMGMTGAQVLRQVERTGWSASAALTAPFARALRRRLAAADLLIAERTFGLRWSGQMTRTRLAGLIRQLPEGVSEIYLHPATGLYPGAAPGYRYREELEALTAPEVIAACRDPAVRLGGFGDFLPTDTGAVRVADGRREPARPQLRA